MDKLYLVLNIKDEPFVINICNNVGKAEELKHKYINNFINNGEKECDFIVVEEVSLDPSKEVLWDAYDD